MSQVEILKMDEAKNNLAYQEKRKIEDMNNKLKLESRVKNAIFTKNNFEANSKLMGDNNPPKTDSRFSNFVRGFRRENTDFFAHAKRHSAVFGNEQQSSPPKNTSPQKMQRSSAIFQRNRPKGEPVLTDFAKRDNSLGKIQNLERPQDPVRMRQSNNLDLHRLRREKTESVIYVPRNSQFHPSQQVKAENDGKSLLQAFLFGSNFYANRFIICVSKACRSHNHHRRIIHLLLSKVLVSSMEDFQTFFLAIFSVFFSLKLTKKEEVLLGISP